MSLLDQASRKTDQADLIILSHVETIRDQMQPATASAVASLIGGAPVRAIGIRLRKLLVIGLVEIQDKSSWGFQLTEMVEMLLRRDLVGFSPSERERRRRDRELIARCTLRSG
jgi:hypothetical protein